MPAYGTPTTLDELLSRLEARVVERTRLSPGYVFATLASDQALTSTPPDDVFVTLRPGRFAPVPGHFAGGALTTFAGTIVVQVWKRSDTDQDLRAVDQLAGLLSVWGKVFGALEGFSPVRALAPTQGLTIEPVRAADPGFDVAERVPLKWGRLDSTWQLRFVHATS